jgi:hypothetical protein
MEDITASTSAASPMPSRETPTSSYRRAVRPGYRHAQRPLNRQRDPIGRDFGSRDSAWKGRHRRSDRATDRPPPLDPFEPVVLFVLGYGVMFVLRPAAMALRDDRVYEGPRATLDVSAGFTEMLVLALLGAAAFVVGYESGLGRRLACLHKPTGAEPPLPRLARAAVLVGLLGALAFVVALASSGGIRAVGDVIRAGDTADLETGGASMYAWFLVLVTIPATLVLVRAALERRTRLLIAIASAFVALVLVQSVPFRSRITHQSSLPRSR